MQGSHIEHIAVTYSDGTKSGGTSSEKKSQKPRIRLEHAVRTPSRSAFSWAPRKLLLVDFGKPFYGYQS